MCYHDYADDTQLYISLSADDLSPVVTLSERIKALHGLGPQYFSDMLVRCEPVRPLRSSGTGHLVIPWVSTKFGQSAFSFCASSCWNVLPDHVRCAAKH